MAGLPFALQLYTVRDHLERDFAGTLARVKAAGYDYVELAGLGGLTPEACRRTLDTVGLTAISTHVGYDVVTGDPAAAADLAAALDLRYVVVPWVGGDMAPDRAGWESCGRALDRAGEALAARGIRLCYHNHNHEFGQLGGAFIFDILMGQAAPEHLAAELDTYWVTYAGVDPVATIRRYAGRCPLLHIKDMTATEPRTFAEVGQGIIDWPTVFAAGAAAGAEWYIVEQDTCACDSLASAATSARFMAAQSL